MPVSAPTSPAKPRNGHRTAHKTFRAVCAEIARARRDGLTWRAIAARYRLPDGRPVNYATLRWIYQTQREPRRADLRHALGLPEYVLAPACPQCGEAHVTRRCPRTHPRTRLSAFGRRMTIGTWADDYDSWREANKTGIESILEWAVRQSSS